MSDVHISSHTALRASQGPEVRSTKGTFNNETVQAAPAQARAPSAGKTAWLEVKHFFTSLFRVRVSTGRPAQVTDAATATQAVMNAMTTRKTDTVDVLASLSHLRELGNFTMDASRDGMTSESAAMFKTQFATMNDTQMMRLYKNFERHPELLESLAQAGSPAVIALDDPTIENQRGGGKVNDLGFLSMSLYDAAKAELQERGFKVNDVSVANTNPSRTIEVFAEHSVANGGDLQAAADTTRTQMRGENFAQFQKTLRDIHPGG